MGTVEELLELGALAQGSSRLNDRLGYAQQVSAVAPPVDVQGVDDKRCLKAMEYVVELMDVYTLLVS